MAPKAAEKAPAAKKPAAEKKPAAAKKPAAEKKPAGEKKGRKKGSRKSIETYKIYIYKVLKQVSLFFSNNLGDCHAKEADFRNHITLTLCLVGGRVAYSPSCSVSAILRPNGKT